MFCDPSNKLYFTFQKPLLHEFEHVNALLQKEVDHGNFIHELESFFDVVTSNCFSRIYCC